MNTYQHGIFRFVTRKEHSSLHFENISDGATVLHEESSTTVPLVEGVNTFPSTGTYTIRGGFQHIRPVMPKDSDSMSVHDISSPFESGGLLQWEDTGTETARYLFSQSALISVVQPPPTVYDVSKLFFDAVLVPDVRHWDTFHITNMDAMFQYVETFDQNLNAWDFSNVTTMHGMFWGCKKFNNGGQPPRWNTVQVENIGGLFFGAERFDQNVSGINTSNVTTMSNVFSHATIFNNGHAPLRWDTAKVICMSHMFHNASAFNQPLVDWDVSSVERMGYMFAKAQNFNQDLSSWDVSNVRTMMNMFEGAKNFNTPLNAWNVSNVETMKNMFTRAESFDQDLDTWNVSNVTNMSGMFAGAASFQNAGKPLDYWDMQSLMFWEEIFKETKVPLSEQHFWEHRILDNIPYQ